MYVNIAVLKETQPHERRVALVPSVIPKLVKLGAKLHMQSGAGEGIKLADAAFKDVVFIADRKALVADADVVLAVQPPALDVIDAMKEGAILISFIYAVHQPALVKRLIEKKITCFAMETLPRITRAQSMDALSSQSALAGYYAVQLGATHLGRVLPKITTAAGVIGPAKVLVMGLGVAGLEALAMAHRLGAVIVDLSAEGGGNCEDTEPGKTIAIGLVTIVAPLNVPSLLGEDASELYAKNQYNLLALMMKDNIVEIDWADEILAGTVLTHAGKLMDHSAKPEADVKGATKHPAAIPATKVA
jgi:NAD/NADP transhydrogenase alpha subunit